MFDIAPAGYASLDEAVQAAIRYDRDNVKRPDEPQYLVYSSEHGGGAIVEVNDGGSRLGSTLGFYKVVRGSGPQDWGAVVG